MTWSSAYARISDDSTSTFAGHLTKEDAIKEAQENAQKADISETWVRDMSQPGYPVIWHS